MRAPIGSVRLRRLQPYAAAVRDNFGDHLAVAGLPAGFAAGVQVLGANRHTSERQISVAGRLGNIVVKVWLQGGEKLTWSDVVGYWNESWARLQQLRT